MKVYMIANVVYDGGNNTTGEFSVGDAYASFDVAKHEAEERIKLEFGEAKNLELTWREEDENTLVLSRSFDVEWPNKGDWRRETYEMVAIITITVKGID